jgi:hypothetical protein
MLARVTSSLSLPVLTFQENVSYGLAPVTARALFGVDLVDGVEVGAQADLSLAGPRV